MDGGASWAAVHGVPKSWTRLSNFTFTFHFHTLEKKMATHSSVLAWRIPGMGSLGAAIYGVTQSQTRLKQLSSSSSSTRPSRTNTQKDVLFIIGDWNAKVGSQETPGVTGKFGLGIQNERGQRLIEFSQENALVTANTLFQQHKR